VNGKASASLPEAAIEILASLAQHRVLSTAQVRAIHLPGRSQRRAQQVLAALEAAGLAAHTQVRSAPRRLWYVSEEGARAVKESGLLSEPTPLLGPTQAAGQLRAHTLAVNDAAIAFMCAARECGDEFGPLAWRHEVFHSLTPGRRGRRRRVLVADAVLTYLRADAAEVHLEQRFLELDRATLSIDALAAELARYTELYRAAGAGGEPLWRSRYPSFPPVICVLAGAKRAVLERRREIVVALLRSDPELSRARGLSIRICLAEDLAERGPFAPIFTDISNPRRQCDWLIERSGGEGR
jgi:Replication-relaxation